MAWVPSVGVGMGGTAWAWALGVPPVRNAHPATAGKKETSQGDRVGLNAFIGFIILIFHA
jgi:hypothetical protein